MKPLLLTLLAIAPLLTGCATSYSTVATRSGQSATIYRLTEQQALSLIATNMALSFPPDRIKRIEGPVSGYKARIRSLVDTWDTTAIAIPMIGQTQNGKAVEGFRFDISSHGTIFSGPAKTAAFKNRLFSDLNQSGTGVPIISIKPKL